MENAIKYIRYDLADDTDTGELINHLSMNGYGFGFDSKANALFVVEDEAAYVETIMADNDVVYEREEC